MPLVGADALKARATADWKRRCARMGLPKAPDAVARWRNWSTLEIEDALYVVRNGALTYGGRPDAVKNAGDALWRMVAGCPDAWVRGDTGARRSGGKVPRE